MPIIQHSQKDFASNFNEMESVCGESAFSNISAQNARVKIMAPSSVEKNWEVPAKDPGPGPVKDRVEKPNPKTQKSDLSKQNSKVIVYVSYVGLPHCCHILSPLIFCFLPLFFVFWR